VNVGMTDLVTALRWVRDNIANFGGDPDKVMIYGQSGGGSKVTTLMGMPSARGCSIALQCNRRGRKSTGRRAIRALAKQIMVELGWTERHRRPTETGLDQTERGRHGSRRQDQTRPRSGVSEWARHRDRRHAWAWDRLLTAG